MPVVPVTPPSNTIALAIRRIQELVEVPGEHFLAGFASENLELAAPHRVFVLPLAAVRQRSLARASFAAWRFLVMAGDRVVGGVDINDWAPNPSASVDASPFAFSTARAIDRVEDLPDVPSGQFEFRVLRVNPLYVAACWLVGESEKLVPLEPCPKPLEADRVYEAPDFLDALTGPIIRPFDLRSST